MLNSKKFFLPSAAFTVLVLFALTSQNIAYACHPQVEKVDICHATDSQSNPYVQNQPDKNGDVDGHDGHNGPVWYPGIADHSWGDIIPPFDYSGGHYAGKNWTTEGQAIWNNDCHIPPQHATLTVDKITTPSGDQTSFPVNISGNGQIYGPASGSVTDSNSFTFEVAAGTYSVSETVPSGWKQDLNECANITLVAGQNEVCKIYNTFVGTGGSLTLTKTNDKEDSFINPGMDVTYTLTVTNNGEDLFDSQVIDQIPTGFTYKAGSSTLDGASLEPQLIGNFLVWKIGDLPSETTKTLVYILTCDRDTAKGTYTNTALASGFNEEGKYIESNIAESKVVVRIPEILSEGTPTELPETGGFPIFGLYLALAGSALKAVSRKRTA